MRFNLLARPAFPCLVAMFGGVWGTNGKRGIWKTGGTAAAVSTRRVVSDQRGMLIMPNANTRMLSRPLPQTRVHTPDQSLSQAVLNLSTNTAHAVSLWVHDDGNTIPGGGVHGGTYYLEAASVSPAAPIRSARPDNLAASISPVSRGRIGHAASLFVALQHGRPWRAEQS